MPEPAKPDTKTTIPTRVILQRRNALFVPDDATPEMIDAALKALGIKTARKDNTAAKVWWKVGEQAGATMEQAILAYTGPAGQADSLTGTFKAPTARSFSGGLEMVAPPKPLVQKRAID